jgi:hypothetical protein
MKMRNSPPRFRRTTAALAAAFFLVFVLVSASPLSAQEATKPSDQNKKAPKPYALIFGTVFDPAGHSVFGVKIKVRRNGSGDKHTRWELISDHHGEFAVRVPAGKAEYAVTTDFKRSKDLPYGPAPERVVAVQNDERVDISLHLSE